MLDEQVKNTKKKDIRAGFSTYLDPNVKLKQARTTVVWVDSVVPTSAAVVDNEPCLQIAKPEEWIDHLYVTRSNFVSHWYPSNVFQYWYLYNYKGHIGGKLLVKSGNGRNIELGRALNRKFPALVDAQRMSLAMVLNVLDYAGMLLRNVNKELSAYRAIDAMVHDTAQLRTKLRILFGDTLTLYSPIQRGVSASSLYTKKMYDDSKAAKVGAKQNTSHTGKSGTSQDTELYQPELPGMPPIPSEETVTCELVTMSTIAEDMVRAATGNTCKVLTECTSVSVPDKPAIASANDVTEITTTISVRKEGCGAVEFWKLVSEFPDVRIEETKTDSTGVYMQIRCTLPSLRKLFLFIQDNKQ